MIRAKSHGLIAHRSGDSLPRARCGVGYRFADQDVRQSQLTARRSGGARADFASTRSPALQIVKRECRADDRGASGQAADLALTRSS